MTEHFRPELFDDSDIADVRQTAIQNAVTLESMVWNVLSLALNADPASTLRIHNVAVWLLFGQVPFLRENYVATTYFRYVICKSL